MLSIGQVAKILGYSASTVRKMCENGTLPYCRLTGPTGHRRIPEDAVLRLAKGKQA